MRQYFTKTTVYQKPEPYCKLVLKWGGVTLQQRTAKNFTVRYGAQVDSDLTYGQAAAKFGEAVMHELTCDGHIRVE